jgi:hypothetical protein
MFVNDLQIFRVSQHGSSLVIGIQENLKRETNSVWNCLVATAR